MPALSFELGAIFLFCAMLMWGTMSGFLPRLRISPAIAIIVTLLVLLAAAWRWSPQLDLGFLTGFLHESPTPVSAAKPATAPLPAPKPKTAKTAPRRVEVWHTTVIESVPPATVTEDPAPSAPQRTKSDGNSPYDSKVKRAAKAVGRFFSARN